MACTSIHVVYRPADLRWHLEKDDAKELGAFTTNVHAIKAARNLGTALERRGENMLVIVHARDGSIETEYVYGDDPRRASGSSR